VAKGADKDDERDAVPRRPRATTHSGRVVRTVERGVDKVVGTVAGQVGKVAGKAAEKLEPIADALHIPVPKTRRSRVLFRSVVVGFLVVAAWIVGLVWWQLRGVSKPDLRPIAEHILEQLRAGDYEKVYEESSPRYQEIVVESSFAKLVADMNATLGAFKEIQSATVGDVIRGPSGTATTVSLVMTFEKSPKVRGAMSFHREEGAWKLLGFSVELPPEIAKIETADDKRLARVAGDPVVVADALVVLLRLSRGDAAGVWKDAAEKPFKVAISIDDLRAGEEVRQKEIGKFVKIVDVTANKQDPGGHGDALDVLAQYDGAEKTIISVHLDFTRTGDDRIWHLASYRPIMPTPRVPAR
jgi:hypothetical protein